jgi:hypothetical protein
VVDPWVTVLGIVVTALVAACGWLAARNHTLNQLVATQRDTIDTLKRQVDRMELTAEITDRVLSQLPPAKAPGVKR